MVPERLKYAKTHEWIDPESGRVGITHHAQEQLGDMVFVEFPEVGQEFPKGERFGSVESVKAVSDCYMPVSGRISAVNEALLSTPEVINQDPYGKGWLVEIQMTNPAELEELMDAGAYKKFVEEEAAKH